MLATNRHEDFIGKASAAIEAEIDATPPDVSTSRSAPRRIAVTRLG